MLFFLGLTEGFRFLGEYRMLIYGAMVVLAMNVRPHGLVDASLVRRFKRFANRRLMTEDGLGNARP